MSIIKKSWNWIVTIIAIMAGIVLNVSMIRLSILPQKLLVPIIIVLVAIAVGIGVLLISKRRRWKRVLGLILAIIYVIGSMVGSYYLHHTKQAMEEIIQPIALETDAISVFVLQDDKAETIADLKGETIGILESVDRENTDYAIHEIEKQAGYEIKTEEYEGIDILIDALRDGKVRGMLVNHALLSLVTEEKGYENLLEEIRDIITISIENHIAEADTNLNATCFNIYLSGIDTYGGVTNKSRSDVNIIMSVNTETKQVLLLSTPRDYYVPLTISGGAKDKLTHAGIYGVDVSKGTLEMLYDTQIPYFLRMNFSGFIDIINALGGINVYSTQSFTVEPIMSYHEGMNHVNGLQALAFARERYAVSGGDKTRGVHQMEVIKSTIAKCQSSAMLLNYKETMNSIAGTFETNIEEERIAQLVNAQLFEKSDWNVVSYSVDGTGSRQTTFSMPSLSSYVMEPNMETVEHAKELLRQVQEGEILVQE